MLLKICNRKKNEGGKDDLLEGRGGVIEIETQT